MKYLFLQYPKCSTCVKARKWLEENNVEFDNRHMVEENPSYEELKLWIERSNLPVKKFFNTSGKLYKEMNSKDKVKTESDEDLIKILATNGMLVRRPLIIGEDKVLVGFKEDTYKEELL